jgi:hypothetical protein
MMMMMMMMMMMSEKQSFAKIGLGQTPGKLEGKWTAFCAGPRADGSGRLGLALVRGGSLVPDRSTEEGGDGEAAGADTRRGWGDENGRLHRRQGEGKL